MVALYREAFACMGEHARFYLTFGAFLAVCEAAVLAMDPRGMGNLIPWVLVAYSVHRLLLLGEEGLGRAPQRDGPGPAVWPFMAVTLVLLALSLAIPFAGLVWAIRRFGPGPLDPRATADLMLFLFAVMQGPVLALFGTALPAAAVRDRFDPLLTLRRARQTAPDAFVGLLVGPGLCGLLIVGATLGIRAWWESAPVAQALGPAAPGLGVLALLPYQLARLFNATLMAVVLCHAYRQVAPPGISAVLRPHPR